MKAIQQCFSVVLFLNDVQAGAITSTACWEKKHHSNKSYRVALSCGTVYCAVQDGSD